MENAHQKAQADFKLLEAGKTDFNVIFGNLNYVINHALEIFKKDPVNLILAAAIPLVAAGLIVAILLPILVGLVPAIGGLTVLIGLVVSIVLSLIAYVAMFKAVVDAVKSGKVDVGAAIGFGVANFIGFFVLGIKILLTIFKGLTNWANSWLSPLYFVENGGKADEAIKSSQATAAGKTATLVWTIILVGICVSILGNILSSIWFQIFWRISYDVAQLGTYIIQGLVTPFTIISHFVLRAELDKHSAPHAAASHTSHSA